MKSTILHPLVRVNLSKEVEEIAPRRFHTFGPRGQIENTYYLFNESWANRHRYRLASPPKVSTPHCSTGCRQYTILEMHTFLLSSDYWYHRNSCMPFPRLRKCQRKTWTLPSNTTSWIRPSLPTVPPPLFVDEEMRNFLHLLSWSICGSQKRSFLSEACAPMEK